MNKEGIRINKAVVVCGLSLLAGSAFSGCATDAKYINPQGPQTIVSLDQINIQDWSQAANQMVESLLESGVLEQAPKKPAVLVVSRIVNDTTQQINTTELTKKIRIALNRTGKIVTTTTYGQGATVEDPLARQTGEMVRYMKKGKTRNMPIPYYSLSGQILENRAQASGTKQVTYSFQLLLTEISSGLAVWEDEVQITKQGEQNSVGW